LIYQSCEETSKETVTAGMKRYLISSLFAFACSYSVNAAIFSYSVGATIPDGNLNGIQNSQTINGLSGQITDVNVFLDISGGFNGDYYAFLSHGNATAVLLNRVGRDSANQFGYPDAGFGFLIQKFSLDDQAAHDIHAYRSFPYALNLSGQLTGSWQPDGRNLDPLSPASAFDSAPHPAMLGLFNGLDANGSWTLYIADTSSGGEGTLVGWGLQITTIPEPTTTAVLGLGLIILAKRLGLSGRAAEPKYY
jgi:subtilisin-like proprotein convertase family protein